MPVDVLVATGHRPPTLGGYDSQVEDALKRLAQKVLEKHDPFTVVSGMALGWDQAIAQAAVDQGRALVAVVPFAGYSTRWPLAAQKRYHKILNSAQMVQHVFNKQPDATQISIAMKRRNVVMLEFAEATPDHVVTALWNREPRGGTAHCVGAAQARALRVVNYYDSWLKYGPGLPPVDMKGGYKRPYQRIKPLQVY
jgi:uncharacterized phage-like protein YoqJ